MERTRRQTSECVLQLLQHKTFSGTGELVNDEWWLNRGEAEEDGVAVLSSRWLDVPTGGAMQPRKDGCAFDHASQLLPIGAPPVQLGWQEGAYDDCSEDERTFDSCDEDADDSDDEWQCDGHHRFSEEAREERREREEPRDCRRDLWRPICAAGSAPACWCAHRREYLMP